MPVTLLLTCVFGITPQSTGEELSRIVSIPHPRFIVMRDEEGNTGKKRLCREIFHRPADLAWFEAVEPQKTHLDETPGPE